MQIKIFNVNLPTVDASASEPSWVNKLIIPNSLQKTVSDKKIISKYK